jgi:hypothetical protein
VKRGPRRGTAGRLSGWTLALAALSLAAGASPGSAATLHGNYPYDLRYVAAPAESNQLAVQRGASSSSTRAQ